MYLKRKCHIGHRLVLRSKEFLLHHHQDSAMKTTIVCMDALKNTTKSVKSLRELKGLLASKKIMKNITTTEDPIVNLMKKNTTITAADEAQTGLDQFINVSPKNGATTMKYTEIRDLQLLHSHTNTSKLTWTMNQRELQACRE